MTGGLAGDLVVRRAVDDDAPGVLRLLEQSLGWGTGVEFGDYFRWKHRENAFGESPGWVATDAEKVVGFRALMRWEFVSPDETVVRAVRAVDTATDPAYQGRGIFRRLTLQAVADLTVAGVRFVFNTPNDQSRPGYLKMGWTVAGRVPIAARPAGIGALTKMVRSRAPAERWSIPTTVGVSAPEFFADVSVAERVARLRRPPVLATRLTPDYLAWRVGFVPLHYRVLTASSTVEDGLLVFRLRRRGPSVEAVVIESFAPDARTARALTRRLLSETDADYVIAAGADGTRGLVPLPRQGPVLTTRTLSAAPPTLGELALSLGDVELF